MAEIVLPLCRTVFLPAGSPGISSIEQVRGDLRDLRCGCTDGEVYCSGEADILVDYISYLPGGEHSPFAAAPTDQRGNERPWQAMLTLPFQLSGKGELPGDTTYRVEMGEIHWCMVAARALEMETTITISTAVAAAMHKNAEDGGDGRTMVDLRDEEIARELSAQNVEVVRIGNAEEGDIREAIMQALSDIEAEEQTHEDWERRLREDTPAAAENREFVATEQAMAQTEAFAAPASDYILKLMFPEREQEEAAAAAPVMPAAEITELLNDLSGTISDSMAAEELLQTIVAPQPEPPQPPETQPVSIMTEPPEPPQTQPVSIMSEPPTETAVATAAPEPDAAETPEIQPRRRKRRFVGLPGISVDADNNNIDITGFQINIRL